MFDPKTWVVGAVPWGLIGLAVFAAGCFAEEPGPQSTDRIEPQFDTNTGSIQGRVLSEEQIGIGGASVGILSLNKETITEDDGIFYLNHVPPGDHVVAVSALGYEPTSRHVAVTAGTVTEIVEFMLVQAAADVPYHKTDSRKVALTGVMWKVTPDCIYTTVNPLVKTCGGIRNSCGEGDVDECENHTAELDFFNEKWETLIGEVRWQPQSGATGHGFHFDINAPNITRGPGGSINQADKYTWPTDSNKSPIYLRVDKAGLTARGIPEADWNNYPGGKGCTAPDPDEVGNCDWFWRLFPAACHLGNCNQNFGPDYGVTYENPVEVYFTFFIKEPAPEGFSALPEG